MTPPCWTWALRQEPRVFPESLDKFGKLNYWADCPFLEMDLLIRLFYKGLNKFFTITCWSTQLDEIFETVWSVKNSISCTPTKFFDALDATMELSRESSSSISIIFYKIIAAKNLIGVKFLLLLRYNNCFLNSFVIIKISSRNKRSLQNLFVTSSFWHHDILPMGTFPPASGLASNLKT